MNLNSATLGSAGIGIAVIGAIYLVAPEFILGVYGIKVQSASEANLFRGAYGGMFIAFAALFCLGALRDRFMRSARAALLVFMAGFALGRIVSIIVDGVPHILLVGILVVELAYSGAVLYLIRREAARA